MGDEYYDIDAILAENQKVQCTFKVNVPDMGHLAGGEDRDIKSGAKIQIPMWMAYILIYSDYADFNIPPPFSSRVRNALDAEARSVRLTSLVGQGGMWYTFGVMIMRLLNDEPALEMSNILVKTFRARLTEVVDQAQHFASIGASTGGGSSGDQGMAFREGLDGTERELFALAQWSVKLMKKWHESTETSRR
ncbi:DNA replication protein [Steccherinum ochraceum]|uniref:DNA replication complex GINS protein PSF3 n=1 Tax=Steccherinum ochraceum TaxID=92696 RepID=A0A4V2MXK6_9APHY|nr:DNA replication protein [Steccherinum ochraceum]